MGPRALKRRRRVLISWAPGRLQGVVPHPAHELAVELASKAHFWCIRSCMPSLIFLWGPRAQRRSCKGVRNGLGGHMPGRHFVSDVFHTHTYTHMHTHTHSAPMGVHMAHGHAHGQWARIHLFVRVCFVSIFKTYKDHALQWHRRPSGERTHLNKDWV